MARLEISDSSRVMVEYLKKPYGVENYEHLRRTLRQVGDCCGYFCNRGHHLILVLFSAFQTPEIIVYHGSSHASVEQIIRYGFDPAAVSCLGWYCYQSMDL